jgi:hypothetical protein
MGPELLAAIVGPILGGLISLGLWLNKKNSNHIEDGFNKLGSHVTVVERKVDDLRVDVAKNYVTNDELVDHIKGEEIWHKSMNDQMASVRSEIRDVRNSVDKLHYDK